MRAADLEAHLLQNTGHAVADGGRGREGEIDDAERRIEPAAMSSASSAGSADSAGSAAGASFSTAGAGLVESSCGAGRAAGVCGAAGLVKRDGAVHNAVVGYRDGALPQLLYALYQPLDAACAVEQRILGMNMKMHKTHFFPFVATLHIIFISGARPATFEAIVFALARFSLSSRSFY